MNKNNALISIMQKINSSMNLQELLGIIIDSAKTLLQAEGASFLIYDHNTDELVFDLVLSEKGEILQGKRLGMNEGVAGIVAQEGKARIINDVDKCSEFSNTMDKISGFTTRNICAVPITVQGKFFGVFEAVNSTGRDEFSKEDQEMLQYLADASGVAVNKHDLLNSLKNRVAELTCIYEISQSIYFTFDIEVFLKKILDAVNCVIKAERCSFMILDESGKGVKYFVSTVNTSHPIDLENSLMSHVIKTGDPLLVFNMDRDFRNSSLGGKDKNYRSNSFICVPMKVRDKIIGILNVTDKSTGMVFDSFDLRVLSTVANQAAETYENIINEKNSIEREKFQKELDIAAEIQQMMLSPVPSVNYASFGAFSLPANMVGGDFYEFTDLKNGTIVLTVGDVSGKGVPAALFMNGIRNSIRYEALHFESPGGMIHSVNRWACNESKNGMFCTLSQAYVNTGEKKIVFYSAGHDNQFFYRKSDDTFVSINSKGKPLGIFSEEDYRPIEFSYEEGDMLILFSDGLIDEFSENLISEERLMELIRANYSNPAGETVDVIKNIVSPAFTEELHIDDSTLLIAKFG